MLRCDEHVFPIGFHFQIPFLLPMRWMRNYVRMIYNVLLDEVATGSNGIPSVRNHPGKCH